MNKKLAISSGNSQASGNGKYSMFESTVTPFFGSMREQRFESLKKQSSFETYRGHQQELNTQEIIQRIVKQNQSRSIDDDGMGDFRLGFSFADEFHSQGDNNFSFDPTLIGQPFSFTSNFQSQSPKFFESNASIDPLFRSGISTYSNPQNHTITNEKKSPFHDFFSFPIDPSQLPTEAFTNKQHKKPSFDKQFQGQSKDIIYEVESKFECEGQTHFLENTSQSKSHQKVSNSQKKSEQIEKKANEYEMLRQSIIKQISQMDSDEWENRNEDFDEIKKQSNQNSNKNSADSQKILSQVHSQQKKINFNESIINKLFIESDKELEYQIGHTNSNQLKISQSMMTFRNKNNECNTSLFNQKIHKKKDQQKNNDSIYESEVEQMTNQRLNLIKRSSKTVTGKSNLDSIQKSKDNISLEKKQVSNENNLNNTSYQAKKNLNFFLSRNKQDSNSQKHRQLNEEQKNIPNTSITPIPTPKRQENSQTEENQNKRKRPVFNLKNRNRLNIKNEVIDERQEFQNEQKLPVVRREFFSENLQIQNDLDSKPIEMYQSVTKQTDYGKNINNRKTEIRLAPKIQNKADHQNELVEIQNKSFSGREKKLSTFNLKRRTPKENDLIGKLKQLPFENKNDKTQIKVENVIKPQQKPPLKKLQLSFNRNYKRQNNEKSLQKSQKLSQASQKHSLSSDGIKIDTKGFMDKVLNNHEGGNNNKNQTNFNKDKKNPILNFKRINRFTSLFSKDNGKEKEKQKQKQKQEERPQISTKKPIPNSIEQTPLKIDKSPRPQLNLQSDLKLTSANQYQSEQKKQKLAQNQIAYKSYEKDQQGSQLSLQEERKNPFVSKYIFSKRTPPKQFGKDNVQSKSKSVTFDTVKRVEINDNDEIDDDNLSFNSVPYQRFPDNNFKDISVKRRENNLMKGINNMSKKQNPIQNDGKFLIQRRNLHSLSSSIPTISSRSRKSAQMMREILDVIEQAHTLQQKLLKVKRQREEEYRRISFLNRIAKQKFSDERIKQMMDWGEMEVEFDSWNVEINR